MNQIQRTFLKAYQNALQDQSFEFEPQSYEEYRDFFYLAGIQHVLPMICQSVYPSFVVQQNPSHFEDYKKRAMDEVSSQILRQAQFCELYSFLESKGLQPLVVKGIILRNMYPRPNFRISVDEDLWIEPEEKYLYHEALIEYGLELMNTEDSIETLDEVSYIHNETGLYVEVHQYAFSLDSILMKRLGSVFEKKECMEVMVNGQLFKTLSVNQHLLFLICHSFKHFIHSGFGIRQISDLIIFSNQYASQIDWKWIEEQVKLIHAFDFTKALYKIGKKYMIQGECFSCIASWDIDSIQEEHILNDILEAGVHGSSEMSRLHSSHITLDALEHNKKTSVLTSSLFLPVEKLKNRYTFLEKYPVLLPVAWTLRIGSYLKELSSSKEGNNAMESLQLGKERVELLKEYKIIP